MTFSASSLYAGSIFLFAVSVREFNKALLVKEKNLPLIVLNTTVFICSTVFLIKSSSVLYKQK
jgi:hypothetical protein